MTLKSLSKQTISVRKSSRASLTPEKISLYRLSNVFGAVANNTVVFNTPGSYTYTAPAGTYVDIQGAAGGYAAARVSAPGKGGRIVVQLLTEQTFEVVVGTEGGHGTPGGRNAGGGGGYSGIFISSVSQNNYVAIAGGGGGCATGNASEDKPGGDGAGNGSGNNGGTYSGNDYGRGASILAGGDGGSARGVSGSALQGGNGGNDGSGQGGSNGGIGGTPGGGTGGVGSGDGGGGGGGAGFFGGGGGGASAWGGGGGGGSGTYNSSYVTLVRASTGYKANSGFVGFYSTDPG